MRFVRSMGAAMVATALVLAGCGGGGGGGSSPPATEAAKPLVLSVKINGADSPASDSYSLNSSDTIEVTSSADVTWASSGDQIRLDRPSSSTTQWKARLLKNTSSGPLLTLKASAGSDAALNKTLTFQLAAGDPRNGTYKVFATNGTRQTLALNFDTLSYSWTDGVNAAVNGSFAEDAAAAGTYVFQSPRITTTANTARFRLAHEAIVGAFPFRVTQTAAESYAIQPFVAARVLETEQAALDGTFNRFGIDIGPTAQTSNTSQFQISGGGTRLTRCNDNIIYRVDKCPAASLQNWAISAGATSGIWSMVDLGNSANTATMSLARIGDQKIFLIAGKGLTDPMTAVFRIGLPESADWPASTGYGTAMPGSWGAVEVLGNNTSTRNGIATDGSAVTATNTFFSMGINGPLGMRSLPNTTTGANYFAMQGAKFFVIGGANDPAHGTNGYLQINLMD